MPYGMKSPGVTFLELIVMLVVVIILTLVSIPSFVSIVQTHRVSANAESLYYALQYARSEAIKRNTNVYVSFTTGDNWCYGINSGSACDCTTSGSCGLGVTKAAQTKQISLSATGYGSNSVYFEGTHGAANASGSITMTVYNSTPLVTISIGRLGNLQMCSTGISGYTTC